MLEHFKGDEIFVKKILDYKNQAMDHQRMILTQFLNPHEINLVKTVIGTGELQVISFGGLLNSENERVIICPDFYEIEEDDFEISVIEVVYNPQFGKLAHKDILGALMNLGIKRECIGDIYESEGKIYFACIKSTYPFIQTHLTKIKRSSIHLREVFEKIEIVHDYTKRTLFLSSLRLDKVVSSMFKVSRQLASEAIRNGHVKVNHKQVEQVDFLCHNNDMISFKRHGRVIMKEEGHTSKQGNLVVIGYFYK